MANRYKNKTAKITSMIRKGLSADSVIWVLQPKRRGSGWQSRIDELKEVVYECAVSLNERGIPFNWTIEDWDACLVGDEEEDEELGLVEEEWKGRHEDPEWSKIRGAKTNWTWDGTKFVQE